MIIANAWNEKNHYILYSTEIYDASLVKKLQFAIGDKNKQLFCGDKNDAYRYFNNNVLPHCNKWFYNEI